MGVIKPIYKNKGAVNDVDNYRGITLLNSLAKLFTSLLNNRLNELAAAVNLIGKEQAGFWAKHSTSDHIIVLSKKLNRYFLT